MGRSKIIAGHFEEYEEEQIITIRQNVQRVVDGNLVFKEDKVTPEMAVLEIQQPIRVRNKRWVDQVVIPYTPEEELHRDAEEELEAHMLKEPKPLSVEEEMDLMLESGPEAVKAKRIAQKKEHEIWEKAKEPFEVKLAHTAEQLLLSKKNNEDKL